MVKNYFSGIILAILLLPSVVNAAIIVPTANLTIVVNTGAHDEGLFHFDVSQETGIVFTDIYQIDSQTSNFTSSQSLSLPTFSPTNFLIEETVPDGLKIGSSGCASSDSDNNFEFTDTRVVVKAQTRAHIICTFNNVDPNQKVPVLIVPGVLGTNLKNNDDLLWANQKMTISSDDFMDPLGFNQDLTPLTSTVLPIDVIRENTFLGIGLNYSKGLIDTFISQGYTEGQDLFTFPYDWRYGVSGKNSDGDFVNLKAFEGQMDYILNQTDAGRNAGKVDVVAHSTGGLLVKQYVMSHPGDHHIGKLVMVGVPDLGSPKAVKVLLQGDNFGVPGLSDAEMKKLSLNMPVVYDLAPSQKYFEADGSFLHVKNQSQDADLGYDDSWSWLADHDAANQVAVSNSEALHTVSLDDFDLASAGVDLYNVIGCETPTFSKVTVNVTDQGYEVKDLKLATGDGTVPMDSPLNLNTADDKTFYAIGIDHGSLLSANGPRQEIVNIVSGSNLDVDTGKIKTSQDVATDPSVCRLKKGKFLGIFSPVSISVTDASGNTAAVLDDGSTSNAIPGVDYEIFGEHKFVFLPTDSGQTYTVSLQGTGDGTFTLQESDVEDGAVTNTQSFANVPVTTEMSGQLDLDQTSLDWDGQKLTPGDYTPVAGDTSDTPPADGKGESGPITTPISGATIPSETGGAVPVSFLQPVQNPPQNPGQVLGSSTITDGTLVLDTSDGRTVYMISDEGRKFGFASEEVFRALGFSFANLVSADLSNYQSGNVINNSAAPHPDGSLVVDLTGTVWFMSHGSRLGIPTWDEFIAHGFNSDSLVPANEFDSEVRAGIL